MKLIDDGLIQFSNPAKKFRKIGNYFGQLDGATNTPNGVGIQFNQLGNINEGDFNNGECSSNTYRFTHFDGVNAK